jgi:hypothetical protein
MKQTVEAQPDGMVNVRIDESLHVCIGQLEWKVVEAAVKWHSRPLGAPRYQEYRDLAQAVDALIAARESRETKR